MKLRSSLLFATASITLALTGCGGSKDASGKNDGAQPSAAGVFGGGNEAKADAMTLAQGPDVCFRAIAKHLGADTKVSEITSFFSAGSEIDSDADEPLGQLTTCTVQYQSPDDPRKLVGTRMDIATGQFAPPSPVEIRVTGGNAAEFKLDDHLIPLSKVTPAALTKIMDSQKAALSGVYSKYAWTGVRLESPGAFSEIHTLRLDVEGRLASNDIKESGYASITPDGQKITTNHLLP